MQYVVEFEDGERFSIDIDPRNLDEVRVDGEKRSLRVAARQGGTLAASTLAASVDGERHLFQLGYRDGALVVELPDGRTARVLVETAEARRFREATEARPKHVGAEPSGALNAPIAGNVVKFLVESGAIVQRDEPVLVIEAMKMQNIIGAPRGGRITFLVEPGTTVRYGVPLAKVEPVEQKS